MSDLSQAGELYRTHFARFEEELEKNGQSWTAPLRREAMARFAQIGFPTTRDEEWKYTNVAPIAGIPFKPAGAESGRLESKAVWRMSFGQATQNQLVFVNGAYSTELSSLPKLPEGVELGSLAAAMSSDGQGVKAHLGRCANYRDHAFVALNTALMKDGAFIYIPPGKVIEGPLSVVFFSTVTEEPTVSHPRNLIVAGAGSQVTIIETYVGPEGKLYLTNAVTELVLGEDAVVEHYKIQRESEEAFHIATLEVRQGRSSNLTSHSIALGGTLVRNDLNVGLDGEGAEAALYGLYVMGGKQHVDNHTRIDHVKPHGTSRELYKGILDGSSRGVFNGKIYVHKAAVKTDAKQTNKNLLLAPGASVDTKPQLEIYDNDVKCSHGSTIGQLDQEALFYIRSRGIDIDNARNLLIYAFASEIINRIRVEAIRSQLDALLLNKFHNAAMKARS